ncbi:hypothetical protein MUN77_08380 [Leucobacter allii]|uniref:hypothetical protein n=1 Tax=Leucobacter allii TaxID=2932247 RepID=UPI001FD5AC6C|nr:hypothetical protein [Leucobacter allii]UOR03284.1 hypothetical protein MUN77_08380 [Leucobacter allii]
MTRAAAPPRLRATPAKALRAEWLKFSTLASNPVSVFAAFALIAVFAVLLVGARASESSTPTPTELLTGASWAQMLLAVLAVVFACTEWSSGTGPTTFLAVPARWPVLAGKAVVMGVMAFLVGSLGAVAALVAGAVGGAEITGHAALAVRLVLGSGAYLAGIAVLAVAIGVIVRNLVAGILVVIGFVWVVPLAVTLIPWDPVLRLVPYLPSPAGGVLIAAESPAAALTPWGGAAVLAAWAVGALGIAGISLSRRDA